MCIGQKGEAGGQKGEAGNPGHYYIKPRYKPLKLTLYNKSSTSWVNLHRKAWEARVEIIL